MRIPRIRVELGNAALHQRRAEPRPDADTTVEPTREGWSRIISGRGSFRGKILSGEIDVDGGRPKLPGLFAVLDDFAPSSNVVAP